MQIGVMEYRLQRLPVTEPFVYIINVFTDNQREVNLPATAIPSTQNSEPAANQGEYCWFTAKDHL
jgi:hypothetical protein